MKLYHTYLLHPGLDLTEATICQHLYWPGLKEAVYIEVTYCDTCQHKKRSIIKYGKIPAKLAQETPWNKLFLYLILRYKICRKGKYFLILKFVNIIDPVIGWFEVTEYNDKKMMTIANLVETTWLV